MFWLERAWWYYEVRIFRMAQCPVQLSAQSTPACIRMYPLLHLQDSLCKEHPHLRHIKNAPAFTAMLAGKVPSLLSLLVSPPGIIHACHRPGAQSACQLHGSLVTRQGNDVQAAIKSWQEFKARIPVFGAIMMDTAMERVLLVSVVHVDASSQPA
jgi:hypothetical protein